MRPTPPMPDCMARRPPPRPLTGDLYPRPGEQFCQRWEAKIKEVIDKYRPDLLWFDARMFTIDEDYRRDFLAYYYNRAQSWGREVAVTYKFDDLPRGAGIVDLERGRMAKATDYPWLTDDSIDWNSWGYVEDHRYKSTTRLIGELVDIVSKNGCLLLNVPPKANGEIPAEVQQRLLEMGRWLKLNGEAIYGTRPWTIFGEGPTKVNEGHFGEEKTGDFTARDIRFTTKGTALYAICLGWPGEKLVVKSLTAGAPHFGGQIAAIKLLGSQAALRWSQAANGLTVFFPAEKPCRHAYVLKISLR